MAKFDKGILPQVLLIEMVAGCTPSCISDRYRLNSGLAAGRLVIATVAECWLDRD
ncbi:MAG: hypothetical protein V7K57_18060 [Nostoc sp.]|uniref:hypothetical protein n=1 Tax=Nostoc sp. TaxID=1180 RepID=UPI002FFC9A5D